MISAPTALACKFLLVLAASAVALQHQEGDARASENLAPKSDQMYPARRGIPESESELDLYHRLRNVESRGDLVILATELGLHGNAAEIGVWHGGFSRHNLANSRFKKYYMIDAWAFRKNDFIVDARGKYRLSGDKNKPDTASHNTDYQIANHSVDAFRGRAVMIRDLSENAAKQFEDEFFDFIYVDAGHEYENVIRDLEVWWPKLKHGGMMAGDDFADSYDTFPSARFHRGTWGVKSAVHNFANKVGSPFFLTYADSKHLSTASTPMSDAEFTTGKGLHGPNRVRAHDFYPAWYMFK